jgi:hypothetical protein
MWQRTNKQTDERTNRRTNKQTNRRTKGRQRDEKKISKLTMSSVCPASFTFYVKFESFLLNFLIFGIDNSKWETRQRSSNLITSLFWKALKLDLLSLFKKKVCQMSFVWPLKCSNQNDLKHRVIIKYSCIENYKYIFSKSIPNEYLSRIVSHHKIDTL